MKNYPEGISCVNEIEVKYAELEVTVIVMWEYSLFPSHEHT